MRDLSVPDSILVFGADGQVGSAVMRDLADRGCKVTGTTRRATATTTDDDRLFLDLALPSQEWPELPETNAVVICTAMTRINECEDDPDGTAVVNLHAPVALARGLSEKGAFVLFCPLPVSSISPAPIAVMTSCPAQ